MSVVATLTLKNRLLAHGWHGKLLAHWMGWFGETSTTANPHIHRINRYHSSDNWVISAQLDAMQSVGIDGVIATWQGSVVNPYLHTATGNLCFQCSQRGMSFALLLNPWICKNAANKEQEIINRLNDSTTQQMLNSSAYVPEKYVLDFDTGADFNVIGAAFPTLNFLKRHVGYSWPELETGGSSSRNLTGAEVLTDLANDNGSVNAATPVMKLPAVFGFFDDGGYPSPNDPATWDSVSRDKNKEVWTSGKSARIIDNQAGNMFCDTVDRLPINSPYAAIVTWNDHDEQTAIEHFCSMLTGIRIGS